MVASVVGLIPPSGITIVHAKVVGESVAAPFLGGIVSGILAGAGLMSTVKRQADRHDSSQARKAGGPRIGITRAMQVVAFCITHSLHFP
jgi:TRAP-type C4-dicarboxylate transport system permease large subunit